jgi:SOS-response transcriptional repressor LexA
MHAIQEKLLKIASQYNLGRMSYREIGKLVGESHPQKVKYHLEQLEQNKLIQSNAEGTAIKKTAIDKGIISIPIMGSADCGPATIFADENIEGYLRVSSKLVSVKKGLYALKAVGNSMNQAKVKGKTLEDGDYAIIDSKDTDPKNNDYVVSVIGGVCNIKKFVKDTANHQIVLLSESSQDFPPIHIHPDETSYFVCGKVVDVIKKPSIA